MQPDNFRKFTGFGWSGFGKLNLWRQDKGQKVCAAAFVRAVETGSAAPIPLRELIEVARATIEGAGELLHQSPLSPTTLRQNVTSPAGTTAAGLSVLMGPLEPPVVETVAAAKRRAGDLSG